MITDEMVQKAAEAVAGIKNYDPAELGEILTVALEAVAPMIAAEALGRAYNTARAQGLREAAEILMDRYGDSDERDALLARAQEHDPK